MARPLRLAAVAGVVMAGGAVFGLSGAPSGGAHAPDALAAVAPHAAADLVVDAEAAPDGQRLYLQHCSSCHGEDGRGAAYGPSLENAGTAGLDFYMRTGRMPLAAPGEPQWRQEPVLDPEEIAAITEYAARFGDGPEIPQVSTTGDVRRGAELYINNCASCHGPSGSGGAIGGGVFAPGLARADHLTVAEAMIIGPGAMPVFAFPEDDLAAVAAYVQYLRQQPEPGGISLGGLGPVPEGFIAVVLGLGLVVVVTRWISRGREGAT